MIHCLCDAIDNALWATTMRLAQSCRSRHSRPHSWRAALSAVKAARRRSSPRRRRHRSRRHDRRSTGAQVEDERIELEIATPSPPYGDKVHVNVTSYNGMVLLTGEVPNGAVEAEIVDIAQTTDRVKRSITRPIGRSQNRARNDTYITSKVKARFVDPTSSRRERQGGHRARWCT